MYVLDLIVRPAELGSARQEWLDGEWRGLAGPSDPGNASAPPGSTPRRARSAHCTARQATPRPTRPSLAQPSPGHGKPTTGRFGVAHWLLNCTHAAPLRPAPPPDGLV